MKLVIAEKPSVAAELAKVLGATRRENGFYSGTEYYVTWCVGHLVETVMPEEYRPEYAKWRITDLPIIPADWKYKVSEGVQAQFLTVKALMEREDVEALVCATDAGREGELIFRLVYQQAGCQKEFFRLWISSMETKAIKDGFDKLKPGSSYDRLYDAAISRLQADWLVGINCSRLFGCMSHQPLNVGRVQTPTVNLIVERQKAIDSFDAKPYYVLTAECSAKDQSFTATKRVEDEAESKAVIARCNGKNGIVSQMTNTPVKENPPALYDLTTLQREANKALGLSAQQTLDATQSLYEKKLVTYPRTDSRYLTADMEASTEKIITSILQAPYLNEKTRPSYKMEAVQIQRLINDKKVTDHHAIIPTMEAVTSLSRLSASEQSILLMVVYKLLAAAYLPHEYIRTELSLMIGEDEFKASGRMVTAEGFKEITAQLSELMKQSGKQGKSQKESKAGKDVDDAALTERPAKGKKAAKEEKEEERIPELSEGECAEVQNLTSKKKATQPPKSYTEDTLLSAMENAMRTLDDEELKKEVAGAGLGTPATRAGIIERIIKTGFVTRKGKNLLPTEKAYQIVSIVPDKVKSAVLTAEWEQKLEQIYKGEIPCQEFLDGIETFVTELVESNKGEYDENGHEIVGKCPRCGKHVLEGRTNYYCDSERDTCNFVIWKDDKFFTAKKKPLTKPMVKALLAKGRIKAAGLYSEKTGSTYTAYIRLVDTGKYVNFRLEFPEKTYQPSTLVL